MSFFYDLNKKLNGIRAEDKQINEDVAKATVVKSPARITLEESLAQDLKSLMEGAPAKADKDYDGDGRIESPKAEVMGSRMKAAKKAGKLDELSPDTLKSYAKKAANSTANLGAKLGKQQADADEVDRYTNRHFPKGVDQFGQREQMRKAAGADYTDINATRSKAAKRVAGIGKAVDRLTKEDASMQSYSQQLKALEQDLEDANKNGVWADIESAQKALDRFERKHGYDAHIEKRKAKANEDGTGGANFSGSGSLEEKAGYSAKKAAAGKDIGKPGKNFEKIAKSAAERYGSEEKGKKVAGAVLAKLRAKESVEEADMEEGNEFSGELVKAKAMGKKDFEVDGKKYKVKEAGLPDVADKKVKMATAKGKKPSAMHNVAKGLKAFVKGQPEPMDEDDADMIGYLKKKAGAKSYNAGSGKPDAHNGMMFETDAHESPNYQQISKALNGLYAVLSRDETMAAEEVLGHVAEAKAIWEGDEGSFAEGLDESVSRRHFQQVADLLKAIEDPVKRKEMAMHHASIFKQQNPRFDIQRFAQAAGVDLSECAMWEELKGGQKKLDVDGDGDIGADDLAKLRAGKKVNEAGKLNGMQLIDAVLEQIKRDVQAGDVTAIEELLKTCPPTALSGYLPEEGVDEGAYTNPGLEALAAKKRAEREAKKKQTDEGFADAMALGKAAADRKPGLSRHDVRDTGYSKVYTRKPETFDQDTDSDDDGAPAVKRGRGRPTVAKKPERVTKGAWKRKAEIEEHGSGVENMKGKSWQSSKAGAHPWNAESKELDEKSVSQAQAHMMAGAAHDPKFAKKVGVSQKVAKEFNKADKGRKISKLPKHVDEEDHGAAIPEVGLRKVNAKGQEIKKKEKKVDETTTSGSVATTSAGHSTEGASVGKGIYDSINREVEKLIAESFTVNMSKTITDNGQNQSNINISATDADADMLKDLLIKAGIDIPSSAGHDHDHSEVEVDPVADGFAIELVPSANDVEFELDEADVTVSQNSPDYPTNQEYSDDSLQYSGGLNKPKSTGQTTTPVVASQLRRQMSESDETDSFLNLYKAFKTK